MYRFTRLSLTLRPVRLSTTTDVRFLYTPFLILVSRPGQSYPNWVFRKVSLVLENSTNRRIAPGWWQTRLCWCALRHKTRYHPWGVERTLVNYHNGASFVGPARCRSLFLTFVVRRRDSTLRAFWLLLAGWNALEIQRFMSMFIRAQASFTYFTYCYLSSRF